MNLLDPNKADNVFRGFINYSKVDGKVSLVILHFRWKRNRFLIAFPRAAPWPHFWWGKMK